jgi:hypothetical protein
MINNKLVTFKNLKIIIKFRVVKKMNFNKCKLKIKNNLIILLNLRDQEVTIKLLIFNKKINQIKKTI